MDESEATSAQTETGLVFLSMLAGNYINMEIVKQDGSRISTSFTPRQALDFVQQMVALAVQADPVAAVDSMTEQFKKMASSIQPPDPDEGLTNP